jgi:hypothetical protein
MQHEIVGQNGGGQRWAYRPINNPVQAEKWRMPVSILLTFPGAALTRPPRIIKLQQVQQLGDVGGITPGLARPPKSSLTKINDLLLGELACGSAPASGWSGAV